MEGPSELTDLLTSCILFFIMSLQLFPKTEKRPLDFTHIDWNCDCDVFNEMTVQMQYFSKYGTARKRAHFGSVPLS